MIKFLKKGATYTEVYAESDGRYLGCILWQENTGHFKFHAESGEFSGTYLRMISDKIFRLNEACPVCELLSQSHERRVI